MNTRTSSQKQASRLQNTANRGSQGSRGHQATRTYDVGYETSQLLLHGVATNPTSCLQASRGIVDYKHHQCEPIVKDPILFELLKWVLMPEYYILNFILISVISFRNLLNIIPNFGFWYRLFLTGSGFSTLGLHGCAHKRWCMSIGISGNLQTHVQPNTQDGGT